MSNTLFDQAFFQHLADKAASSPRQRANYNLHKDYNDPVQRLFITMAADSYVRPHRHTQDNKFECFLVMSGTLAFLLFDDDGCCIERHILGDETGIKGIEIPPHTWHCAYPLTASATFFEVKPGPYEVVEDKDFATWAPKEGEETVSTFMSNLRSVKVGERVTL